MALQTTCALRIDSEGFRTLLGDYPAVAVRAFDEVAGQLSSTRAAFAAVTGTVAQRVAGALVRLAAKFGDPGPDGVLLQVPLTRADLAGMTGSTTESVSRAMSAMRRDGVIDQFRSDPHSHVLLMSYGAGSVGLNLQFASYVFLFDRWWNPAVEDQAINRAHRIGAAGPVTVTRFLAVGTIEERIDRVLAEKRELFNAVFNDDEAPPPRLGLSRDEIFGLFNLRFPDAAAA